MSLIREDDGSFVLHHKNSRLETEMDRTFDRWPGEMRWSPKRGGAAYSTFEKKHQHCRAVIIGKGPSLDQITNQDFTRNDVIICCNDSVHRLVSLCLKLPIYSVQLDESLRDTCKSQHATHFISSWAKDWVPDAVVLPRGAPKRNEKLLTAIEAIRLGKHIGAGSFYLMGFDAMHGKLGYANCIGYSAGKNPKRFLAHKDYIEAELRNSVWLQKSPL